MLVPAQQAPDREGMAQVMEPWRGDPVGDRQSKVATRWWKAGLAVTGWTGLRPSKVNSGAWAAIPAARARRAAAR